MGPADGRWDFRYCRSRHDQAAFRGSAAWRRHEDYVRIYRCERTTGPVQSDLVSLASAGACDRGCPLRHSEDREMVARVVGSLFASGGMAGRGGAFTDYAERSDLPAHRRNRRGTHHFFARTDWRSKELGLSVLLGARRHINSAISAPGRISE